MTNDEIRRHRLNELIADLKTVAALARALDVSPSQVSQWRNASPDSKTGKPRSMSDGAARRIEIRFGKPRGWMDTPPLEYGQSSSPGQDSHGVAEPIPAGPTHEEVEARARSLSQRANEIAAMWMRLPHPQQDEIEAALRDALSQADTAEADRTLLTRSSTPPARKLKLSR